MHRKLLWKDSVIHYEHRRDDNGGNARLATKQLEKGRLNERHLVAEQSTMA
jgi:hypothetical protein